MKRIGYLGPKGTFSQEAVLEYVKEGIAYEPVEFNSISDIPVAVQNCEIDEAVIPIENSIEGAISVTLDMLAFEVDLKIKAEVVVPIRQNLLVREGTERANIRYIISHPQPIGQCRKYISANFPAAEIQLVYSTAGAAIEVAKRQYDSAAIGSTAAAEVYGLKFLDKSIQDGDLNHTRFVVLSKEDGKVTGADKTSIVFSTEDKPGSLYRVLDIFSLWDINMTRIESRPAKEKLGRYIFFVDIQGHRDDPDLKDALTMIQRKTSYYKFLGSYPEHKMG